MTRMEILEAYDFVEKEDLLVWPENCIAALNKDNVDKILAYLSKGPLSGEELFVLDLPVFMYPADKFKMLWEALLRENKRNLVNDIRDEEITPSDEFERLSKKMK